MSEDLLRSIDAKLQTIINNQERQYILDKDWKEQHEKDQKEKWQQISSHMPNLGNIDLSQMMNMATQSLNELTEDKKNFDFGVVRRPARKYDEQESNSNIPEVTEGESNLSDVDSSK